jgi:hypothetical protein
MDANTTVPTRLKKYKHNWYAVAAVATAFQLSVDNNAETKAIIKDSHIDFREPFAVGSIPSTSTVIELEYKNLFEATSNTVHSLNVTMDEDYTMDIAIKPRYVNEFKIKVAKLKIDKSLPKIFAD